MNEIHLKCQNTQVYHYEGIAERLSEHHAIIITALIIQPPIKFHY